LEKRSKKLLLLAVRIVTTQRTEGTKSFLVLFSKKNFFLPYAIITLAFSPGCGGSPVVTAFTYPYR
jgi:hypothetical protein